MTRLLALTLMSMLLPAAAHAQISVAVKTTGELEQVLALKGDPARGKSEFRDCGGCHRKNATGRANLAIPRLSGQHASVILKQIVDIREGRRINTPMQPILEEKYLSLQTFADIASYLASLPVGSDQEKGPESDLARGKTLYETSCAGCHGSRGEGRAELFFPMLASQHFSYLLREMWLIREGGRGNSNAAMAALLKGFGEDDLRALASYAASLPPPN